MNYSRWNEWDGLQTERSKNESWSMKCGPKKIKMKHDHWGLDWRKWDETLTMKSIMKHPPIFVPSNLPILETSLKQFQLETRSNLILQTLITYVTHEWREKYLIPTDLVSYYTHCSDITFCEGILLKNERIVVLTTLRTEIKPLIH